MILTAYEDLEEFVDRVNYTFYLAIAIIIVVLIILLMLGGLIKNREKDIDELNKKINSLNNSIDKMNDRVNDVIRMNSNKNY